MLRVVEGDEGTCLPLEADEVLVLLVVVEVEFGRD